MLKKNHKLNRDSFTTVSKNRKSISNNYFSFMFIEEKKWDKLGISFVVSKKIDKKAVNRNKIKRRCYYAAKKVLVGVKMPFKGVFFVKKDIVGKNTEEIQENMRNIFKKAKLM